MDVQLPNGTIIRGVPDGTSKADILAKLKAAGHDTSWAQEEAAPAEPQGLWDRAKKAANVTTDLVARGAEGVGNMWANAPASAAHMYQGIDYALTNPQQTVNTMGDLAAGGLSHGAEAVLPQSVYNAMSSLDPNPEATARARDTASAYADELRKRYGSVDAIGNTMQADPIGVAGDLSMALGGGGAMARGAGATRLGNAMVAGGDAINPLNTLRPLGMVAEGTPGAIAKVFNPKNEAYLKATEGKAPEIIKSLEANQPATPGSTFTAADAAADTSGTMFPALQEKVKGFSPTAYADQAAANEAARTSALGTFAKTPEELQSAVATRKSNAEKGYGEAGQEQFIADPALEKLINTSPSIEQAIKQATTIGKDVEATGGTPFTLQKGTPAVEASPGAMVKTPEGSKTQWTQGPATEAAEAVPTTASGADLHTVQMALKDMMTEAEGGIAGFKSKSIGDVRKQLVQWLENNSERYAAVKQKFIEDSKPINEMQIGQQLQRNLRGELGVGEQRAGVFDQAVENAPKTITNSIGAPIFKTLDAAIGPENTAIVKGIQQDMAREALAKRRAGEGAGKGLDVPNVQESIRPGQAVLDFGERIYRALQGRVTKDVATAIANEMVSPTATAAALKKALAYDQVKNKMARGMQVLNGDARNAFTYATPAANFSRTQD